MMYKISPVNDYYTVSRYNWFSEQVLTREPGSDYYVFRDSYIGDRFATVDRALRAIKEAIWLAGIRRVRAKRPLRKTIFVPPWPK